MDFINFEEANIRLGAPKNWDEKTQGPCGALPARVIVPTSEKGHSRIESFWKPSETDIANILSGGLVRLTIWGDMHPPVSVEIFPGDVVKETPR